MALRANMRRIWIPEPSAPLRSANERTREPGATYPPPLRRRVPPPDPDCGRQAAARGGVAPTRRCGRRSALSRVPQRPEGGFARRQRPSPRRFVPDWRAPSLARGRETSRRRNLPPIRGYRPVSARNRASPSVPSAPPSGWLAHDCVVHMQIVADGTDDDLPRIEPDSDRHRYPMSSLNLVCISRDGLLHSERRITRAHGMILVGDGRAEEGHNPIAHNPVHGALIVVDRLDHAFEHRIEELLRVLGVAVSKQLHRALNICEQHGDLLPLTLESCPGGEDLIGKMLGRVTLRRGKARIVPNGT